jgi:hypothetical protein
MRRAPAPSGQNWLRLAMAGGTSSADRHSSRGVTESEGRWTRPCGFGRARGSRLRPKETRGRIFGGSGKQVGSLGLALASRWLRLLRPASCKPSDRLFGVVKGTGGVGFVRLVSASSGLVASAVGKGRAGQSGFETLSLRSTKECFREAQRSGGAVRPFAVGYGSLRGARLRSRRAVSRVGDRRFRGRTMKRRRQQQACLLGSEVRESG